MLRAIDVVDVVGRAVIADPGLLFVNVIVDVVVVVVVVVDVIDVDDGVVLDVRR